MVAGPRGGSHRATAAAVPGEHATRPSARPAPMPSTACKARWQSRSAGRPAPRQPVLTPGMPGRWRTASRRSRRVRALERSAYWNGIASPPRERRDPPPRYTNGSGAGPRTSGVRPDNRRTGTTMVSLWSTGSVSASSAVAPPRCTPSVGQRVHQRVGGVLHARPVVAVDGATPRSAGARLEPLRANVDIDLACIPVPCGPELIG